MTFLNLCVACFIWKLLFSLCPVQNTRSQSGRSPQLPLTIATTVIVNDTVIDGTIYNISREALKAEIERNGPF